MPQSTFGVCYHMVSDHKLRHLKHYRPVSTRDFDHDVRYLNGRFRIIGHDEALRLRGGMTNSHGDRDNHVVLTFDDGFAQCATVIRPILLRHETPAIFFIITDLIDNRRIFRESRASLCIDALLGQPIDRIQSMIDDLAREHYLPWLTAGASFKAVGFGLDAADVDPRADPRLRPILEWLLTAREEDTELVDRLCDRLGVDVEAYLRSVRPYLSEEQIRQLHSDGFTIGAHSRSHQRLQAMSRAEAESEIVESCRIVRDLTGQHSVPFAFPYSGWGLDRTWLAQLRVTHDYIGLFYDTGGFRRDAPNVVQRVFGERVTSERSIDGILRRAWATGVIRARI